jgi:PAT family beta-lactamase induction signal transducer AmpG
VALYTSWLYLPWVIKPLWSPLIELLGTKRQWIWSLQAVVGVLLALVAFSLPADQFVQWSLAGFWLMAFASASHDIAADGFYLLALSTPRQAAFVGVRSTFYRLANVAGQGGLVFLAGHWGQQWGSLVRAWQAVLLVMAVGFFVLAVWHWVALPRPEDDRPHATGAVWREFLPVLGSYFRKPGIAAALVFLLLYRFPEAQLLKLAVPFLLDAPAQGGLGLSNQQVGIAYGTVGLLALTVGGIAGGLAIARWGLRACLWPLALVMHLPNAVFLVLAWKPTTSVAWVSAALAVEQFGYGLGFAAYLMVMVWIADGPHKTAHYALCTGFMALGMMIPGLWSGWLQAQWGYLGFFAWVMVAALPSFAATALLRIPAAFGRR